MNHGIVKVKFKLSDEKEMNRVGFVKEKDRARPYFYTVVEDKTNKEYNIHITSITIICS